MISGRKRRWHQWGIPSQGVARRRVSLTTSSTMAVHTERARPDRNGGRAALLDISRSRTWGCIPCVFSKAVWIRWF